MVSLFQITILFLLFIILSAIFFTIFAEQNILLSIIYLETAFVTLTGLISFFAFISDDFFFVSSSVILLILAAGDSVIAISLLVYLNRIGQSGGLSYFRYLLVFWYKCTPLLFCFLSFLSFFQLFFLDLLDHGELGF
jgi:hypothetical protein